MFSYRAAVSGALTLLLAASSVAATDRGLAWATDNTYAPLLGDKPMVTWYHHWQNGPVSQMPSKDEYVPMYWGPQYSSLWASRVAEMKKKTPKHLLGMNEPDVQSQSNLSPSDAVTLWMKEIHPWAEKGVQVGSPAIVYNMDWLDEFLTGLKKKGGYVDFVQLHWYGSYKDIASFQKFVAAVHSRFGYHIWVTELGITTASHASASQTKTFMMNAYAWMDSVGYVDRASWFGCFLQSDPPDNYATGNNALFKTAGHLSDNGFWYVYTQQPDRRSLGIRGRHHYIAARSNVTEVDEDDDKGAVHCDHICELRNAQLDDWEHRVSRDEESA